MCWCAPTTQRWSLTSTTKEVCVHAPCTGWRTKSLGGPRTTPLAESSSHSWASQYRIALLPGVLARVRQDEVSLLLVAPFWPVRVWFLDLISLLDGSPCEIPVRRDLLSQAGVYHPRPEMWKLWGWPLRGRNS